MQFNLHPDENVLILESTKAKNGWLTMSSGKLGRPSGKVKTAKIEITIEPEIKKKFMEMLHTQNKQASVVLREWITEFLNSSNKE